MIGQVLIAVAHVSILIHLLHRNRMSALDVNFITCMLDTKNMIWPPQEYPRHDNSLVFILIATYESCRHLPEIFGSCFQLFDHGNDLVNRLTLLANQSSNLLGTGR